MDNNRTQREASLSILKGAGSEDGFVAFVAKVAGETPEREIYHCSWENCAVGDYARSLGVTYGLGMLGEFGEFVGFAKRVVPEAAYNMLNCRDLRGDSLDTYGELNAYLCNICIPK